MCYIVPIGISLNIHNDIPPLKVHLKQFTDVLGNGVKGNNELKIIYNLLIDFYFPKRNIPLFVVRVIVKAIVVKSMKPNTLRSKLLVIPMASNSCQCFSLTMTVLDVWK